MVSYKDLLVVLDSGADTRGRIDLAAALAERFAAHLVGLYAIPSSDLQRRAGYADLAALEPVYREWRARVLAQAEETREAFEHAAQLRGLATEWRGGRRRLGSRSGIARALRRSGDPRPARSG